VGQGKAIDAVAAENVHVAVVGNPCNTNAWICAMSAPRVPKKNFSAMTRLDQNRAMSQLASKAGVHSTAVTEAIIWGNHSATQYPDIFSTEVKGQNAAKLINDQAWLESTFIPTVQQRGAAIIKARGLSSAASAANAACNTVYCLTHPTPAGDWFSVGVYSDGSYGVAKDIIFSFPIRTNDGKTFEVVQGVQLSEFSKQKIAETEKELLEEKSLIADLLH
jgi:malate dehydrogenase